VFHDARARLGKKCVLRIYGADLGQYLTVALSADSTVPPIVGKPAEMHRQEGAEARSNARPLRLEAGSTKAMSGSRQRSIQRSLVRKLSSSSYEP
jgi:hypothetical protein